MLLSGDLIGDYAAQPIAHPFTQSFIHSGGTLSVNLSNLSVMFDWELDDYAGGLNSFNGSASADMTPAPEPSTGLLFGLGLIGLGAARRRRS